MKLNNFKFPLFLLSLILLTLSTNSLTLKKSKLPDITNFSYASNDNILQNAKVIKKIYIYLYDYLYS